jgi:hypothetical protein
MIRPGVHGGAGLAPAVGLMLHDAAPNELPEALSLSQTRHILVSEGETQSRAVAPVLLMP